MLMLMSAFGKNPSVFKSLSRLQEKESDRLQAIIKTLKQMNIEYHGDEKEMTIFPQKSFASDLPFDTFNDHRMAMALMMCAPKATSPYVVKGVECIDKSYPDFLSVYQNIGGQFKVLGEQS
jgi:3-phosphoshikimate 1-carboxyvinyltransferase